MKERVIKFNKTDGNVDYSRLFADIKANTTMIKNGQYECVLRNACNKRSIDQNALMWLWFTCIADELGETKEKVHNYYCNKFLTCVDQFNGMQFYKSQRTSDLNQEQMRFFLEKVQEDAASEFGITLPSRDDEAFAAFLDEYNNKGGFNYGTK